MDVRRFGVMADTLPSIFLPATATGRDIGPCIPGDEVNVLAVSLQTTAEDTADIHSLTFDMDEFFESVSL